MTITNPLLIGLSGLQASQRGIATTGHNISNVNTEGFSRQRVDSTPRQALRVGATFLGTGVELGRVRRIIDEYAISDVRNATINFNHVDNLLGKAARLDDLLADSDTGLAPGLQSFFQSVQGLTTQADSIPSRQVLLSQGQLLVQRFQKLDVQLRRERESINVELSAGARQLTQLAKAVADINQKVLGFQGSTADDQPNDLFDAREELLRQMGELAGITVVPQDSNQVSVFVGNGQPLVVGTEAQTLTTQTSQSNPGTLDLVLTVGATQFNFGQEITGGKLGGAIEYLNGVLEKGLNRIGLVAVGLADRFNTQHALGVDLNGNLGGDFFTDINANAVALARVSALGNPAPTAVLRADVTNVGQLTDSDYQLRYDGANYTLTRVSDNTVVSISAGLPVSADGFSITLSGGVVAAGDTYRVQPTKNFTSQLAVQVTDTRRIAAALPIRVQAPQIPTGNTGSGVVRAISISATGVGTSIQNGSLAPPVNIVFTSATTYEIRDSAAAVLGTGTFTPGQDNNLILTAVPNLPNLAVHGFTALSNLGYEITLGGTPLTGDSYAVSYNTGGVGGNDNAIRLASIQGSAFLDGGGASLSEAYGTLVTEVGTRTREAEINRSARETLLQQSEARRESVSGVNLDEEAANLIKYQQAYAANAQVISVANQIFDTLLNSVR
ncbi:MAG: flagellar hook-associated protein FlgK [Gammaproteobacteria bacterium]|nr:flagellar hook-associated protein FlgK [Gammaproteobacteria bacterium]